jgi:hypothetical protein
MKTSLLLRDIKRLVFVFYYDHKMSIGPLERIFILDFKSIPLLIYRRRSNEHV